MILVVQIVMSNWLSLWDALELCLRLLFDRRWFAVLNGRLESTSIGPLSNFLSNCTREEYIPA
jgi:hypothetical protein